MKFFSKKNYISSRQLGTIFLFCLMIFIFSFYRPLYKIKRELSYATLKGYELSNLDILCSFNDFGSLDTFSYILIILPLFSVLIIYMLRHNKSLIGNIRYKERNRVWNKNILLVLISAFILSTLLVVGGYLVSGIFFKGYNNTWNTESGLPYFFYGTTEVWGSLSSLLVTYKVILVFWITTFLGLCFIGAFICTSMLFIRNIYIFGMVLAISFIDCYNFINFRIMLGIRMYAYSWTSVSRIICNNLYFLTGFLGLYFLGRYVYSQKDQGIQKKS